MLAPFVDKAARLPQTEPQNSAAALRWRSCSKRLRLATDELQLYEHHGVTGHPHIVHITVVCGHGGVLVLS